MPSLVHSIRFVPLPTAGQLGVLHAPVAQDRSHLQALEHETVSQASVPEHVIAHFEPDRQLMSLHALAPVQLIVQSQPGGHDTVLQLSVLVQSMMQVFATSSQVVQSLGQFGTTHKLFVHWRLSANFAQSAFVEHSNASDGRSTKHAASIAAPISAPRPTAFIAQQLSH